MALAPIQTKIVDQRLISPHVDDLMTYAQQHEAVAAGDQHE